MNNINNTNDPYPYFKTYHFITLHILQIFLNFLYTNWYGDNNTKNVLRLLVLKPYNEHDISIKKGLFLLNLFKDILDDYQSIFTSPIAVYLRINDKKTPPTNIYFLKDEINRNQLNVEKLKTCKDGIDLSHFNEISFNEIFDAETFKSNDTLALYMGLPNYLSKQKSIMMITYGYSGVGKTYTLFGGSGNSGILQKSLTSIQGMKEIYSRSYEIYGMALPYKSYWANRNPSEYYHSIFVYNIIDGKFREELKGDNMKDYLNNIKGDTIDTYTKIEQSDISKFSVIVENIEEIRKNEGRIKKTINNPVSSRSIMVYEFKVKLTNDKFVRFVVMDLPGKEDILNSYVKPNNSNFNDYCIELNDNIKKDTCERALRAAIFLNPILLATFPHIAKLLNEYMEGNFKSHPRYNKFTFTTVTINQYSKNTLNTRNIKELIKWNKQTDANDTEIIYNKNILNMMKEYIKNHLAEIKPLHVGDDTKTNNNILFKQIYTSNNIDSSIKNDEIIIVYNYKEIKDIGRDQRNKIDIEINKQTKKTDSGDIIKFKDIVGGITEETQNTKKNFKQCILASENLRYLLENNRIDILLDFYSTQLINDNHVSCNKHFSAISFEGFYINENILGLINTLNKKLNPNPKSKYAIESMENYFSDILEKSNDEKLKIHKFSDEFINSIGGDKSDDIQYVYDIKYINNNDKTISDPGNETRSQTYFLRDFLRNNLKDDTTTFNTEDLYTEYKYNNNTIKQWFEETYDFNKTYAEPDQPPIATFMEAYFEKDVIDNFYLFYVASNESNCENQIKLISDSKIFIETINKWEPSKSDK
jgi:hypothetical protein